MLPFSEACERNKGPILTILTAAFGRVRQALEIGSGTGQHAVYFSRHLPHLRWQPTDRRDWLDDLRIRVEREGSSNLLRPIELDVRQPAWPVAAVDAVFTANTLHIMSWTEVEAFFLGVGRVLEPGGVLAVYGPFRYRGEYTSASNAAFDLALRDRDPASGIRDFELICEIADRQGIAFDVDHAMPANNQLLLFRKARAPGAA
ncbi:MAG: class I SAM-dependent methyltransferase [Steroidobacteraceae bacterium]|nr:class I SAM-dependent methyltransferase [Steroidobacteraceae bacterium]